MGRKHDGEWNLLLEIAVGQFDSNAENGFIAIARSTSHQETRCRMKQHLFAMLMILTLGGAQTLLGQFLRLDVNVELTGSAFNPNTVPERNINTNFREDDPFNPVRAKFFPTIKFNETFRLEGDFLFDNKAVKFDHTRNQPFRADGFFLAIRGLYDNRLNFWLGRIPTPVGTFSPRSYSHINPLIGFPLAYHLKVPYNAFRLSPESSNLVLRNLNYGAATSIYEACWITGISAFGNIEGFEYMFDIGQGTLTNPEARENGGFQIAGRVGYSFTEQISAGISGGIAPYLQYDTGLPLGINVRDPKHIILGFDASTRLDNLQLAVEAFYNSWDTPQYQVEKSIHAYTWYLEGQYFFLQNLYAASRIGQMLYDNITDPVDGTPTPWGYNVTRIETGVGFLPLPELNIKGVIQYNRLDSPSTRDITILAIQTVFHFENLQKLVGWEPIEKLK